MRVCVCKLVLASLQWRGTRLLIGFTCRGVLGRYLIAENARRAKVRRNRNRKNKTIRAGDNPATHMPLQDAILKFFTADNQNKFPVFWILARIAVSIPMNSAQAERGFSALKWLKNHLRNRIGEDHLDEIMEIFFNLRRQAGTTAAEQDAHDLATVQAALEVWYSGRERRITFHVEDVKKIGGRAKGVSFTTLKFGTNPGTKAQTLRGLQGSCACTPANAVCVRARARARDAPSVVLDVVLTPHAHDVVAAPARRVSRLANKQKKQVFLDAASSAAPSAGSPETELYSFVRRRVSPPPTHTHHTPHTTHHTPHTTQNARARARARMRRHATCRCVP